MRRFIPLLALTLSAEVVGALLTGSTPASADPVPTPDPIVDDTSTAPIRTGLADDPPPVPTTSTVAPSTDVPTPDRVIDDTPALPIRTGRVGDPAALTAAVGATEPAGTEVAGGTTAPATSGSAPGRRTGPPPASPPAPAPGFAGVLPPPTKSAGSGSYTVLLGDNLWEIAAAHLATATGRDRAGVRSAEITAYWLRLCVTNRARVHSGDVNLIYAGEVIELPPV